MPRYFSNGLPARTGRTRTPEVSLSNSKLSPALAPKARRISLGTVICPLLVIRACFCKADLMSYSSTTFLTLGASATPELSSPKATARIACLGLGNRESAPRRTQEALLRTPFTYEGNCRKERLCHLPQGGELKSEVVRERISAELGREREDGQGYRYSLHDGFGGRDGLGASCSFCRLTRFGGLPQARVAGTGNGVVRPPCQSSTLPGFLFLPCCSRPISRPDMALDDDTASEADGETRKESIGRRTGLQSGSTLWPGFPLLAEYRVPAGPVRRSWPAVWRGERKFARRDLPMGSRYFPRGSPARGFGDWPLFSAYRCDEALKYGGLRAILPLALVTTRLAALQWLRRRAYAWALSSALRPPLNNLADRALPCDSMCRG